MGWTSYYVGKYIDRKKECDDMFAHEKHLELVKSRMIGSTYYAAIRCTKEEEQSEDGSYILKELPKEKQKIFGCVVLTSVHDGEFAYKELHECAGPYEHACPESILKLLTPTENEYSNHWREECRKHNEAEKMLKNAPLGTRVKLSINNKETIFEKYRYVTYKNGKFKEKIRWMNMDTNEYITIPMILERKFEILDNECV